MPNAYFCTYLNILVGKSMNLQSKYIYLSMSKLIGCVYQYLLDKISSIIYKNYHLFTYLLIKFHLNCIAFRNCSAYFYLALVFCILIPIFLVTVFFNNFTLIIFWVFVIYFRLFLLFLIGLKNCVFIKVCLTLVVRPSIGSFAQWSKVSLVWSYHFFVYFSKITFQGLLSILLFLWKHGHRLMLKHLYSWWSVINQCCWNFGCSSFILHTFAYFLLNTTTTIINTIILFFKDFGTCILALEYLGVKIWMPPVLRLIFLQKSLHTYTNIVWLHILTFHTLWKDNALRK